MRRWSGGLITPRMGPDELAYELDRSAIQKDFDGPRTIAFINPKGGAAKTTGVLAAGYTFGTVRGGGVVAWDNNETRGTLGIRGTRSTHRNTTRELLEDLERFTDVYQSRIGDLGSFVRSQGDAHFDVLASDERPDVTGTIRAQDFDAVHKLLERFYRIILIDTGNNMRAENWLAAAGAADLLVVTSTVREDTGYSGLWMLDALQDAGYQDLKHKTVTILSDPSPTVDTKLAADLVERLRAAHPRRLPRALRPGAGRRLRGALRPALRAHPDAVAQGLRRHGRRPLTLVDLPARYPLTRHLWSLDPTVGVGSASSPPTEREVPPCVQSSTARPVRPPCWRSSSVTCRSPGPGEVRVRVVRVGSEPDGLEVPRRDDGGLRRGRARPGRRRRRRRGRAGRRRVRRRRPGVAGARAARPALRHRRRVHRPAGRARGAAARRGVVRPRRRAWGCRR